MIIRFMSIDCTSPSRSERVTQQYRRICQSMWVICAYFSTQGNAYQYVMDVMMMISLIQMQRRGTDGTISPANITTRSPVLKEGVFILQGWNQVGGE